METLNQDGESFQKNFQNCSSTASLGAQQKNHWMKEYYLWYIEKMNAVVPSNLQISKFCENFSSSTALPIPLTFVVHFSLQLA